MASNEDQTCPRPEDVEEAQILETQAQILETHGVSTLVHEMKVDGYHLVERKQKTNVTPNPLILETPVSVDVRVSRIQSPSSGP